ncbi:hypothetical protein EDC04DRAFT_3141842 [Pisolithus marmoratus]|nr:hypothetical protein EDC04DRAFT_3141842 [Pisolithus marmoratus]
MANFRLDNPEQFISLVNLLSLRNNGQLQQSHGEEEEHEDNGCEEKRDEFKQRFLDRFAEMMSREKDGKRPCCVALRESGDRYLNADFKISLIVARSADFNNADEKFRSKLERLLGAIGTSVYKESNDISAIKKDLWEELLCYNQPRLDSCANSLRDNLKAFKAAGSLDSLPSYRASQSPQNSDSELTAFCDSDSIGPYSVATHIDYLMLARKRILELDDILCIGDRTTQRRLLAEYAYSMRHMKSLRILINSSPEVPIGRRLLSDILVLGHLRTCYFTLVEAALNLPGFANLSIIFVKNLPRRVCPAALPPLADAMQNLGLALDPTSVQYFISETLGVTGAKQAFKKLQNGNSRQHLPTHAELQLVLHLMRTTDINTMDKEVYPYIGCSKLSCFLCSVFIKSLHHNGIKLRTCGSHGKIYTPWSIPDVDGLCADMVTTLHSASNEIRHLLVREMLKPITITAHAVESWLPQNLYVLGGPYEFLAVARSYLSQADREKEPHQLVPEAKRKSFMLYAMLLNGYRPDPSIQFGIISKVLYFEFGFVTGRGSEGEQVLPWVYRSLISKCSFREFWTAFQSNDLVALMDAKGLGPMRKEVQHFEAFMTIGRNYWCPTVWPLRCFVNSPDMAAPLSVTMDYGFFNCKTVEETFSLKGVYKELLESPKVDPIELHAACAQGKLYDFARGHKPNLERRFKKLMINIYPLYNNAEGVRGSVSIFWLSVLFLFLSITFTYLSDRVYPRHTDLANIGSAVCGYLRCAKWISRGYDM